ncbi:ISNCY family transposase [Candidatus Poribacteria bacterium]|nr:ISNCY family transposase [Candidatus Poribacteria bacterium]
MGTLRLSLNCDYDRLHELVNEHKTIREMLGHGIVDQDKEYTVQTLRDNVCLLTPEILDQINQVVVKHGHKLVKKKSEVLETKCDSFVLETDVHYPTDINLLSDAIRKVITLTARLCEENGITEWRQAKYNLRKIKRLYLRAQNLKRSSSQNQDKKDEREKIIIEAHRLYIKIVNEYLEKAETSLCLLRNKISILVDAEISVIEGFVKHAKRQIEQIKRRVMDGEKIPHQEKVFSIFESYTEWISKGKAGVPVEFGMRVCIMEDQYGFILNSRVMEKETDDKVAVNIVAEAKKKFSSINSCSFDRGFYSPSNKIELAKILDKIILPKKGKLNKIEKEIENAEEFRVAKRRHSGVESAINALEVHGLDRCLDKGIHGFKRYVALAVVIYWHNSNIYSIAKDLSGNALQTDYIWTFTTALPDTTTPQIISVYPLNNATGVSISGTISVTFSEPMNTSTINSSTFTVTTPPTEFWSGTASGKRTFNSGKTIATFTPNSNNPLVFNAQYTVTITTGVKDLAGNALPSDYSWKFTTERW